MSGQNPATCVGAGRTKGWLTVDKMQAMSNGWGHVQSDRFAGDLVFNASRSPLLSAPDSGTWKQSDPVTFEVVQEIPGMCEAVNIALVHQEADPPLQIAMHNSASSGYSPDPREITGNRRIEGQVATDASDAKAAGMGYILSPEFTGLLTFHVAENPMMSWGHYKRDTRVSFTIAQDPSGQPKAMQVRILPTGAQAAQSSEAWVIEKRRRLEGGGLLSDTWTHMPKMLPASLFCDGEPAETRIGIAFSVFQQICTSYRELYPGHELPNLVKGFIWQADQLFGDDGTAKRMLAQRLNKLAYFREADQDIKYTGPRCKLMLAKKNKYMASMRERRENRPLCWYYKTSECTKGAECPFRHNMTMEEQVFGDKNDEAEVCWFWTQGTCTNGARCAFRHYYKVSEGGLGYEASCVAAAATGFSGGAVQQNIVVPSEQILDAAQEAVATAGPGAVRVAAIAAASQAHLATQQVRILSQGATSDQLVQPGLYTVSEQ